MTDWHGDDPQRTRSIGAGRGPTGPPGDQASLAARFASHPLGLRADGLIVPEEVNDGSEGWGPVARYMSWRLLFGETLSVETVDRLLAPYACEHVLTCAALLLSEFARQGLVAAQRWAADTFLAADARPSVHALLDDKWIFLAPQLILAAVKRRLLLDDRKVADDTDITDIEAHVVAAVLGIADLIEVAHAATGPGGLPMEMLKNQYFNAQQDVGSVLGRGRRFYELMHELDPATTKRMDAVFKEVTGASFDDISAIGLVIHIGTDGGCVVPAGYLDKVQLEVAAVGAALAVLSGDIEELRAEVRAEAARVPGDSGDEWAFNAFRKHPALRHSDGRLIVLRPDDLIARSAGYAFELKTRTALREQVKNGRAGSKALEGATSHVVGAAYEAYVGECLRAQVSEPTDGPRRIWDDRELGDAWPNSRHCDFVVDFGEAITAIEVVSKRLVEPTYAGGDRDSFEQDLAATIDKKARQIHELVEHLLSDPGRLGLGTSALAMTVPIFPLIVATGGFPWDPLTAELVHRRVENAGLLGQERVRPLRVISLRNLEQVEALVENGGPSLGRILLDSHSRGDDRVALDHVIDGMGFRLRRPSRLDPIWSKEFRFAAIALGVDPSIVDESMSSEPGQPND